MSKLLIFVALLVAVCQADISPFDDWCRRCHYVPCESDPMEYYECHYTSENGQVWDIVCPVDGYVAHPSDPTAYFQCEATAGQGWHLLLKHCPNKTFWSVSTAADFYCWMGFMPHETDPHEYYQCVKGPQGWITYLMHCPANTTWVQNHWRCDVRINF
ncbi:unnamed protein product [Oppiella nova]|uniref:Chitin-binding type-2 domain-containing protein n=1 Tax=Oppiella nova TaxID=334625 RepID=A0A7R9LI49_9ACAR|nr:unnamed protein product [Oppiella nova]CAG2163830.1 unnamed protein product [Oppiella nova]